MNRFDWAALLRCGVRQCGLRPAEFWALTPAEFGVLIGVDEGGPALSRDGFAALMAAYPDAETKGAGDG